MRILLLLLLVIVSQTSIAQIPPQLVSYRATALNASNMPILNSSVGVKISIQDSQNASSAIYSEIHLGIPTDGNGLYSLRIGAGVSSGGTVSSFSQIDWTAGLKYLKIQLSPTNNGNYSVNAGITQLMSVPYAFTAESAQNVGGFEMVNNIVDLKALSISPNSDANKIVYVKGYFNPGDGGEGLFMYKTSENQADNLGTILTSNTTNTGRWIRQYSGQMHVEYFGVQRDWAGDPVVTNSMRLQKMIDYAAVNNIYNANKDVTILFNSGQYFIDKPLIVKNTVRIMGSGTTLLTNNHGNYDYMFLLDKGPVTNIRMENFIINCNYDSGGIYFKASFPEKSTERQHGGLWNAVFKNIEIQKAVKHGIYLEGGEASTSNNAQGESWMLPHQFMIFENVRAYRPNAVSKNIAQYNGLRLTGYNANYTFLNCEFTNSVPNVQEGYSGYADGICVYIGSIDPVNKMGAQAVSFINSGFGGYSQYGAVIENAGNITFDSGFYEGMDIAFDIRNSQQITISNNRFANAAGMGSLPSSVSHLNNHGRIISAENSIVNIWNNNVQTSLPDYPALANQYFIMGIGNNNVINVQNNSFTSQKHSKSMGIYQTIGIINNTIDILSKKLVLVTAPATYFSTTSDITRINSDISATETIFIRANGGPIKFLPMAIVNETTGKNIYLNGRTSLTLQNGQGALFMKIDGVNGTEYGNYELISVSN